MEGQIDEETKKRRADLIMEIQTGIMSRKQAGKVGQTLRVLCDGLDDESGLIHLPHRRRRPRDRRGGVASPAREPLYPGRFYDVHIEESDLYDLYGRLDGENTEGNA